MIAEINLGYKAWVSFLNPLLSIKSKHIAMFRKFSLPLAAATLMVAGAMLVPMTSKADPGRGGDDFDDLRDFRRDFFFDDDRRFDRFDRFHDADFFRVGAFNRFAFSPFHDFGFNKFPFFSSFSPFFFDHRF